MKNKLLFLAMGFAFTTQMIMAQVPSYVPTNGLVGYWPFSGNANDESGNGNNGTVYSALNTAAYVSGVDGQAIYLTGFGHVGNSGDHVLIPAIGFNNFPSYTISIWIKHDGNTGLGGVHGEDFICGRSLANPCNGTFAMSFSGNFPNYEFGYGNGIIGVGAQNYNIDANNWTLHTLVIDNGIAKGYKNGILFQTASGSNQATLEESIIGIGTHWFCSGGTQSTRFIGGVDNLGIWNRALTQQEITNLYNSTSTNECLTMTINTGVLSTSPVTYTSTVNIYPNPANDQITIDCGNLANVVGWNIKITNMLGQEVFNQPMNTQQYVVPLNSWTGQGMYFVKIINAQNEVVNIKKIILQ